MSILIESELDKIFSDALDEQARFGRQLSRTFQPPLYPAAPSISLKISIITARQIVVQSFIKFFAGNRG